MTGSAPLGRRIAADAIRFERVYARPVEAVWQALTTPAGLARWLGDAAIDLRSGGDFTIRLQPNVVMDGRVLELDAPRTLVLSWHESEDGVALHYATTPDDRSEVAFELEARGAGTLLALEHRSIRGGEIMSSFGAGWHALLDALRAVLDGFAPGRVSAAYEMLHPAYTAAMNGAQVQ